MNQKHQVHNLIILDESGSMESIKNSVLQGFNEIVQTIQGIEKEFPDQEHFISMISFNGLGQKLLHFIDPVSKLNQLNHNSYNPQASTPLFDAMGFGLHKLDQHLANLSDYHVLVTILTDGEENASKEYSGETIHKMVQDLKEKKWTFTYIGADHDVVHAREEQPDPGRSHLAIHDVILEKAGGKTAVVDGAPHAEIVGGDIIFRATHHHG